MTPTTSLSAASARDESHGVALATPTALRAFSRVRRLRLLDMRWLPEYSTYRRCASDCAGKSRDAVRKTHATAESRVPYRRPSGTAVLAASLRAGVARDAKPFLVQQSRN